ncbi:MAG TPA: RNA polymerase sigma factor RpoD, partial [Solibacterales bacterium]|nr:RNA polymerase sigma factor RpoD [Bryobacterales bacterium]
TREGEIELAKRIERGQKSVRKALSRSALIIREVLGLREEIERGQTSIRDVLLAADLMIADEALAQQQTEFLTAIEELEKDYRKAQQSRQKLQVISRQMKPKQHRSLRFGLARGLVRISRSIREIQFSGLLLRRLAACLRRAVDEF